MLKALDQWAAGSGLARSLLGDYTSAWRDESRKTRPVNNPPAPTTHNLAGDLSFITDTQCGFWIRYHSII